MKVKHTSVHAHLSVSFFCISNLDVKGWRWIRYAWN